MSFLTADECLTMLAEEGVPDEVLLHINVVTELALEIAECAGADTALVHAAALLHDIGRSRTHGIDHAVVGADILRERGLHDAVVDIVERHVGAGITADEAGRLGLPFRDYIPVTLEQKVVSHADNLIAGCRRQTSAEHQEGMRAKGLDEQAERAAELHRELSELCGYDLDDLCR